MSKRKPTPSTTVPSARWPRAWRRGNSCPQAYGTPTADGAAGRTPTGPSGRSGSTARGRSTWSTRTATPSPRRPRTRPESIDTITVGGSITIRDPAGRHGQSRHPTANANVYFQNLIVTPTGELGKIDVGQVSNFRTSQNGIHAIDMPNFYLAHTETTKPEHAHRRSTRRRCRPARSTSRRRDHASLRRRGRRLHAPGRDAAEPDRARATSSRSTGPADRQGTSIIVNTVNTDAQANSTAGSPPSRTIATFLVTGRLNLFQANDDRRQHDLGPGAVSIRQLAPDHRLVAGRDLRDLAGRRGRTGQIGDVRVGGNATNFTTFVDRRSAQRDARRRRSSTPRSATSTSAARPTTSC